MKNIMFGVVLFLSSTYFSADLVLAREEPVLLDTIVVVVNHEVITKLELDDEVQSVSQKLKEERVPLPSILVLRKQVLERMIMQKILVQNAVENGLQANDDVVKSMIGRIMEQEQATLDELKASLKEAGLSFDRFREQVKERILISQLKKREIDARITITESDIADYLAKNQGGAKVKDEYLLAHILILVPEGATADVIKEKKASAGEVLSKLREGTNFRQVSASSSDAENALEGGALGWRSADRLPEIFLEVAKDMAIGDVSDVLRSANGFHIIKLLNKRGNNTPVIVKQTKASHILLRLNEIRSDEDAEQQLIELRDRILLGGVEFSELAKQFSEDVSSSRGGDLGWLSDGQTVPVFEETMSGLEKGEVSIPVKSTFGWHLIQVTDRRDQDMSDERQRTEAKQAIREKKSDQAYQEWIRVQRDKAYIKYLN